MAGNPATLEVATFNQYYAFLRKNMTKETATKHGNAKKAKRQQFESPMLLKRI